VVGGYRPKPGDTYAVLTTGAVNGQFDTFTAPRFPEASVKQLQDAIKSFWG